MNRSAAIVCSLLAPFASSASIQAADYCQPRSSQRTTVVCQPVCPSPQIVWSNPTCSTVVASQPAPAVQEAMIMQRFEETYNVMVPVTSTVDGVTRTEMVQETRTREVMRAVPASQVIEGLQAQVAQANIGEAIDRLDEIIDKLRKIQPQEQPSLKSLEDEIKKLKDAVDTKKTTSAKKAPESSVAFREWHDTSGRELRAKFVSMDNDSVVLQREDGKTRMVLKCNLSESDKTWLSKRSQLLVSR